MNDRRLTALWYRRLSREYRSYKRLVCVEIAFAAVDRPFQLHRRAPSAQSLTCRWPYPIHGVVLLIFAMKDSPDSATNGSDSAAFVPTVVNDERNLVKPPDCPAELSESRQCVTDPLSAAHLSRRRELNRIAAQRCRQRRKEKAAISVKEVQCLQARNTELRWKVADLQRQKERLLELMKRHCSYSEETLAVLLSAA